MDIFKYRPNYSYIVDLYHRLPILSMSIVVCLYISFVETGRILYRFMSHRLCLGNVYIAHTHINKERWKTPYRAHLQTRMKNTIRFC